MPEFFVRLAKPTGILGTRWQSSAFTRYALAILGTIVALLIRRALDPALGDSALFVTLFPVIAFSAYFLGRGPAVVSVLLGLIGDDYFIMPPKHAFSFAPVDITALFTYVALAALLTILVAEASRRSCTRLQEVAAVLRANEIELNKTRNELEDKVAERTRKLAENIASLESEINIRKEAEQQLRSLSARMIRLQDEDRRRIARELHDGVGQSVIALKMTLGGLGRLVTDVPNIAGPLHELEILAAQILEEIRATSYLLHPPLLDELGFSSAAAVYVEGFSKRTGIEAALQLSHCPLAKDAELVLFRILQESLTNIFRHSGSKKVEIRLHSGQNAVLSVRDYGKGIPAEILTGFRETGTGLGVGLSGMNERAREQGGRLMIESDGTGTCITATLPFAIPERLPGETDRASAASGAA